MRILFELKVAFRSYYWHKTEGGQEPNSDNLIVSPIAILIAQINVLA